jgi:hypothetical protein
MRYVKKFLYRFFLLCMFFVYLSLQQINSVTLFYNFLTIQFSINELRGFWLDMALW